MIHLPTSAALHGHSEKVKIQLFVLDPYFASENSLLIPGLFFPPTRAPILTNFERRQAMLDLPARTASDSKVG